LFFTFSSSIFTCFEIFECDKPLLSAPTIKTWRSFYAWGIGLASNSTCSVNLVRSAASTLEVLAWCVTFLSLYICCSWFTSNGRLNISPLVLSCISDLVLTHFVMAQNLLLWGISQTRIVPGAFVIYFTIFHSTFWSNCFCKLLINTLNIFFDLQIWLSRLVCYHSFI
jgi:hypothetical protein